ncbi:DinB family protein [Sphingobacterium sp. Mn56C]|uniref:DinB family protein n=1 Tax=Sphingobacterium sp. Mn56C TaxID=3395261 RepID=UPI003BC37DAE
MDKVFKFIIDSRRAFIQLIDGLSLAELNAIPDGFSNNIIWNFGHIVVSTPGLCYIRTGLRNDPSFIKYGAAYTKGTKPTYFVSQEEVDELKALAISTVQEIEADYKAGVFAQITPVVTATYNEAMDTIEELIAMTSGHDNLHFGYAKAQHKLINTSK